MHISIWKHFSERDGEGQKQKITKCDTVLQVTEGTENTVNTEALLKVFGLGIHFLIQRKEVLINVAIQQKIQTKSDHCINP